MLSEKREDTVPPEHRSSENRLPRAAANLSGLHFTLGELLSSALKGEGMVLEGFTCLPLRNHVCAREAHPPVLARAARSDAPEKPAIAMACSVHVVSRRITSFTGGVYGRSIHLQLR